MATYEIIIHEAVYHTIEVEADDRESAVEKAFLIYLEEPDTEYETDSNGVSSHEVRELNL
jgi:hypothetical protein